MSEMNNNIKEGFTSRVVTIQNILRCLREFRWSYVVDMAIDFRVILDQEIVEP